MQKLAEAPPLARFILDADIGGISQPSIWSNDCVAIERQFLLKAAMAYIRLSLLFSCA